MRGILALAIASAFCSSAFAAMTMSDQLRWLENDSSKRRAFIKDEVTDSDRVIMADLNYQSIEYWLYQLYDIQSTQTTKQIDPTHSVALVSRGLNKPTEVVYNSPEGQKILFTNDQGLKTPTHNIIDIGLSPLKDAVYAVTEEDGSIDQVTVQVYDLKLNKARQKFQAAEDDIGWLSNEEMIYPEVSKKDDQYQVYDFKTGKKSTYNGIYLRSGAGYSFLFANKKPILHNVQDQSELIINCNPDSIVAATQNAVIVRCPAKDAMGELRKYDRAIKAAQDGTVIVPAGTMPMRSSSLVGDYLSVMVRNGADRWYRFYDLNGKQIGEMPVPNYASVSALTWQTPGQVMRVTLKSAVRTGVVLTYDLAHKTWSQDPEAQLMTIDAVTYKTEVLTATSKDGAKVPVRVTHRADARPDGSHPAYFESYGGFGLAGYLDPSFVRENLEFMRRGGVMVGPGVRGGDEFGGPWHEQAKNAGKINTFNDLAAAVKQVIAAGWTKSSLVISTGTSNGGLTVSATALLNPDLFGLVIPISGVDDLLSKDRTDARDDGWDDEYGSAKDPKMQPFLQSISPVENSANYGHTNFVIVDGLQDTRVNFVNSIKLGAALQKSGAAPDQVNVLSFDKSGHWLADFTYQNSIAWHVNALIWTKIFAQAGWKF